MLYNYWVMNIKECKMNKKFLYLIICLVTLTLTLPLLADETHPINKAEQKCLDKSQSTADMLKCTNKAYDAWDKEMNKYYNLLMKKLPVKQKSELLKAQKTWLAFRDNNQKFITTSIWNGKQGTMYLPIASGENMEVVKQRALQLKSYYLTIFD